MSGFNAGAFWSEMAQLMHNATMDYANLAYGLYSGKKNRQLARSTLAYQKEYDKNAIQWRVADAKKAGLHPLYALGANTQSAVQNVFDTSGKQLATGVPPMDFSKYSKMAMEQGRLQNEQMRLQNEKLRLQNEAYERKAVAPQSQTSVARKDGFENALKTPPIGFDKEVQNMFSLSRQTDGSLHLSPSKDIQVDDLGAYFSYPAFYAGKWFPASKLSELAADWANSPSSPYSKELKPDQRWVVDWIVGSGNRLIKRTIIPNSHMNRAYGFVKRVYDNYDYSNMSWD